MTNDKDTELRQVMAEEGSRGRARPLKAENIQNERRMREVIACLESGDKEGYLRAIREDLELSTNSDRYRKFLKLWQLRHGT